MEIMDEGEPISPELSRQIRLARAAPKLLDMLKLVRPSIGVPMSRQAQLQLIVSVDTVIAQAEGTV